MADAPPAGPRSLDLNPACDVCLAVGGDLVECFAHLQTALAAVVKSAPSFRRWDGVREALQYLADNGARV